MTLTDTSKQARKIQIDIYRAMPITKKAELIFDAYRTGQQLAMARIKMENPNSTKHEIWHKWARQHLGEKLYNSAYGKKNHE